MRRSDLNSMTNGHKTTNDCAKSAQKSRERQPKSWSYKNVVNLPPWTALRNSQTSDDSYNSSSSSSRSRSRIKAYAHLQFERSYKNEKRAHAQAPQPLHRHRNTKKDASRELEGSPLDLKHKGWFQRAKKYLRTAKSPWRRDDVEIAIP